MKSPVSTAKPSSFSSHENGRELELSGHVDRHVSDHTWVQLLEYEREMSHGDGATSWKLAATFMTETDAAGDWHTTVPEPDTTDLTAFGFSVLIGQVEDTSTDNTLIQPGTPPALLGTQYELTVVNKSDAPPQFQVYQKP